MKKKNYLSLIFIVICMLFLIGCSSNIKGGIEEKIKQENQGETIQEECRGILKVHYIDVGQGDCILIQQDNYNMLIDAGNNTDNTKIKNYINKLGIKSFDYIIGTHCHADHIGAMSDIVKNYDVKKFYFPKQTASTKTFENLIDALRGKGLTFSVPEVGEKFSLGTAECVTLAPGSKKYKDANNYSIVLKVTFGNKSFLFTGDAEDISEKEMLKNNAKLLKSDVLKVGHHGSESSTTDAFLKAVNPSYAVISVGANNDYGHPNSSVIDRLKQNNVKVFRTDQSGTIIAETDGEDLKIYPLQSK